MGPPDNLPRKYPGGCKGAPKVRVRGQDHPPLFEVSIENAAGEAFPADPDALQHPVAAQLVHDQVVVHHAWGESVRAVGGFLIIFFGALDTMGHSDTQA